MPLFTDNIEQARSAYFALEQRAEAAERLAQLLRSTLDDVLARPPNPAPSPADLPQVILNLESENAQLRGKLEQAIVAAADLPLQNFIASLGLAAAIGEAGMPDRVIPSLSATIQSYIRNAASDPGLRFFQPGIDQDATPLSTTSFELAKIPPHAGVAVPRNLYSVLQDKQTVYSDPYWSSFATPGTPTSHPASDVVTAIAVAIANTGNWNFAYLVQASKNIGTLEQTLSTVVSTGNPSPNATAYRRAADSLLALVQALTNKPLPVVGDLMALTAALDNVTDDARSLLP